MSKIGKNIKKIRNIKRLSQQAFADLFNLTRGNISSYEELRAEPKIETVVNIANYFSIPLNDFILKDLSVNELLHFDTNLVTDLELLKKKNKFRKIPYIGTSNLEEYILRFNDPIYITELPKLEIPNNSKFTLIAFEIDSSINLPSGLNYKKGDILIFESVEKENIHLILHRFGFMFDKEGLKMGIYLQDNHAISLTLNDWVKYPFQLDNDFQYWVLQSVFCEV